MRVRSARLRGVPPAGNGPSSLACWPVTRKKHFERFEDHTRLKHFLLEAYLKQWATILARRFPRLWFIDAFAGAGRDRTGAPGSPVIAAEVARAVAETHFGAPIGTALGRDRGLRVVAIEADHGRYLRLRDVLRPFGTEPPIVAFPREGTLPPYLDDLLRHIGSDPALYFLDPFGVEGLDAAVLPRLLNAPHAEILVLFSDEGAVRLAGKAGAVVPTREELLAARRRDPSMFGDEWDAELAAADRRAVDLVLAGHASNARADEILGRAFGDTPWRATIDATPQEERRERFVDLYEGLLCRSGAEHVLRFRVTTGAGRHKYTLLHASKQVRAFAAMKDAMHRARAKRQPDAPDASLFDCLDSSESSVANGGPPEVDTATTREATQVAAAAATVARHFAGRSGVRWTGGYSDDTVQAYARDHTPLLIHQFEALQQALERRGHLTRRRPIEYTFPGV